MSPDDLLAALDPEQRAVATALRGPVCVLAGAGTGKTRALTHRIAYGIRTGVYRPDHVLAVTFTARAAGEMRTRLRTLGAGGVQARTFHAAALRQLSYFWPKVVGGAPPRIAEAKAQLVAEAARRVGLPSDRTGVRDLAAEVEWAKVSLVVPDEYALAAAAVDRVVPGGHDASAVARLMTAYEQVKDERGVIDFEDVLLLLAAMLAERADVGDQVRGQYRHFVVDEYQDVSPLQQYLLDQWLGGRRELCVVGDPSQTIYSFAGATPHHLLSFTRVHPEAQVVRLVRDYRSTPQVVELANRVIVAGATERGGSAPLELRAQRPDGPQVRWAAYADDEAEAAGVAAAAARLVADGVPAREIAVLYRTNAQSEAFEEALSAAGVPYQVRGGERFFARRDVREAIVYLRGGARAADVDVPLPEAARDLLRNAGWTDQAPATRGAARERWEALTALARLADEVDARVRDEGRTATVADLVTELDERAAAQHAPAVDGVTLASLHAAKGLEWDAVFLTGLSEGLLPTALAETPDAIAEERRLLYVGVTRAREHLQLSYARSRLPGGRPNRRASRFLEGLWPGSSPRAAARRQDAEEDPRTTLTTAVLLRWREQRAAELGVAPGRVLATHVLHAVAQRRPGTRAELAQVPGIGAQTLARLGDDIVAAVLDATGAPARPGPR
ncbi:ATP-dependent helicase [Cellulomonas gilvus]|uniref:DNA 3'-5' helicase n=1 Tax=Cellulomonas gilvus (strain ATCC 13127 / NRRL B-14078) TaxID=593907 RepID=F8A0F2_CELGA|nr:ATP-dependent DNA helicase UvrD2 [Cellulomonas gilvus]AEI11496.1 UvrD/REP helicase [Cellulomonas gilvus ATCC 13127]